MITVIFPFFFTSEIPSLVRPALVWWTTSFSEPPPPVATHPKLSCTQHTPHPNVLSSPRPWSQLRQSSVFNPWGSLTTGARRLQSHNNGRSPIRRDQTLPTAIYWLGGMVPNGGSDCSFPRRITCHRLACTHLCVHVCVYEYYPVIILTREHLLNKNFGKHWNCSRNSA